MNQHRVKVWTSCITHNTSPFCLRCTVCVWLIKIKRQNQSDFSFAGLNAVYIFSLFKKLQKFNIGQQMKMLFALENVSQCSCYFDTCNSLPPLCLNSQVWLFSHAGKCGLCIAYVAFCQQCVRAMWLPTQAGKKGGVQWLRACKMVLQGPG